MLFTDIPLGQGIAWKYSFMAAGTVMLLSTVVYHLLQRRMLGNVGLKPVGKSKVETKPLTAQDYDKMKAIFILTAFSVLFFAFFEQAGSSLSFFADEATELPKIFGFQFKSTFFQSVNPMFILILTPFFSWIWKTLKKHEPSIPGKFGWGLLLQGIGFIIITIGASVYLKNGNMPVSILYLTGCYFFSTVGELCLSPIGLSMIRKLAPVKYMSLFMGVWFLSSFLGNFLAGQLASYYEKWDLTTLFSIPAILSIIFALLMWAITKKVKTWMHGVV
ncbi:MAG: oligopeptide:H+ symporter [Dysgonamonadaceae bacterium]|jgi:POT family proton-dependent oligopeptide transporter|nr:oligopeptide:H+ symporter [Dysgonamonadaceae bacterium]